MIPWEAAAIAIGIFVAAGIFVAGLALGARFTDHDYEDVGVFTLPGHPANHETLYRRRDDAR